ncbi:MAG: Na+/H+ antiporter subunit A [Ancrocorticia sp.]|uniref:Na+/H+ antiporter subunit A n=1 Tax=Ancrocorticia sp. TaxID=2593684 RepID=UPI003F8DC149
MPALLLLFVVGALCAPIVMNRGRLGFALLSAIPGLATIWFLLQLPAAFRGEVYEQKVSWLPQLGFTFDVRIDALSTVMALLVTGVGTLVLLYSARYFSDVASHIGRFAGVFVAFSGAMLGLVITDNTLALYMFWELTTVFSFLLIGHYSSRGSSRRAAMQAIIVTTLGGLAMLIGIIMLGAMPGGSYSLHELVAAAQAGNLGYGHPELLSAAVVLMLIGAFSKSALIPFHFWLPAAMAAPTPVSAYLHAAAMVKAGVYLVARLAPGFADVTPWKPMILVAGIGTLLIGGYRALKQHDLKLVLAFGTVSQLGLITLMVGYGTAEMALAGLMMLCAHALFKSTLFLTVGAVDVAMGTRDLRQLTGLGRKMPVPAVFAGLATASMIGFPPMAGFVAKEAALGALVGGDVTATITWVAIAVGSALTVAYGLRFWWGAFATKDGVEEHPVGRSSRVMTAPIVILSSLGLILGIASSWWSQLLEYHADLYPGSAGHLALWHGFGWPLLITLLVFVAGFLLFLGQHHFVRITNRFEVKIAADKVYQSTLRGLEDLSGRVTGATQRGSLPAYLSTIFGFTLVTVIVAGLAGGANLPDGIRLWDSPAQGAVVIVVVTAAVLAARSRRRMKAVLLMGVVGYGIALIYELYGAPDLALTQVLSETITLVVFVLVVRRLPPYFSNRPLRGSRSRRIMLAGLTGLMVSLAALIAANAREHEPISTLFAEEGFNFGYGRNIVNVTLVDIRAWDTLSESAVLVVCAMGIASLLFVRDRTGRTDRLRNILGPAQSRVREKFVEIVDSGDYHSVDAGSERPSQQGRERSWLSTVVRRGVSSRPVILVVGTRIVFYSIVMVSLFLLFSGHNQPGGGFAGGLLAGIAFALRYLAGGRFELGAALPVLPSYLMGGGLLFIVVAVIAPVFAGGVPLQTAMIDATVPIFGSIHIATALIFDIGVYLAVVGMTLEILRSLGGEIDRHGELEGLQGPDDLIIVPHEDDRAALKHEMDAEAMLRRDEESDDLPGGTQGSGTQQPSPARMDHAHRELASPPHESSLKEWERGTSSSSASSSSSSSSSEAKGENA